MSRRLRRLQRRNLVKTKPIAVGHETKSISGHDTTATKKVAKSNKSGLFNFYDTKYKTLLVIPFLILIFSIGLLGFNYFTDSITEKGYFVDVGVSIKGGLSIAITGDVAKSISEIETYFNSNYPNSDVDVRDISVAGQRTGVSIEASGVDGDELLPNLKSFVGNDLDYSVEETGPSLGQSFFSQMIVALLLAFVLMGIVVFISFRTLVPSFAVILSAASDMIITLAIVSLLNVKLSLAGIAAFLMLIGYSVDTDILLTTRVLKRKAGSVMDRVMSAFETGITMNLTTLAAVGIALIFSTSDVLKQIMLILFIGLLVDMINTWIQNVGILRLYIEKRPKKEEEQ